MGASSPNARSSGLFPEKFKLVKPNGGQTYPRKAQAGAHQLDTYGTPPMHQMCNIEMWVPCEGKVWENGAVNLHPGPPHGVARVLS